ncbi:hypothetical protein D3C85_1474950 [compost metagenome]
MDSDAAMNLVMQADFFIEFILVPAQLNPIHPKIGIHNAWLIWIFRIHLRQGNECAAILWPGLDKWKVSNADFLKSSR